MGRTLQAEGAANIKDEDRRAREAIAKGSGRRRWQERDREGVGPEQVWLGEHREDCAQLQQATCWMAPVMLSS